MLRKFVVSTLSSYTGMSNAVVGNMIEILKLFHIGTNYKLPVDDTIVSKHVGV